VSPNPQDGLPFPPRPTIERYKKLAKRLAAAHDSGDVRAIRRWAERWIGELGTHAPPAAAPELPASLDGWIEGVTAVAERALRARRRSSTLAAAQLVVARAHGFASWPAFARHVESLHDAASVSAAFERAADAVVEGDERTLRTLLKRHPELARARSARQHRATLLHYVAANGVEGYRQRTPPNAVAIAKLLLRAGADVDATADAYGDALTTLQLAATSLHPERAGVIAQLLRTLVAAGADPVRRGRDGRSPILAAIANGRLAAADVLAAASTSGAAEPLSLAEAAAAGDRDRVEAFFTAAKRSPPTPAQRDEALRYAAAAGRAEVAATLVSHGAAVDSHDEHGQTPLHLAAMAGSLATVETLIALGAPLGAVNAFGGTPLGQTRWSAEHGLAPERAAPIIVALEAAERRRRPG